MSISNEPTDFTLNEDNLLETLLTFMPDQLHAIRSYQSKGITVKEGFSETFCDYIMTPGGEQFRLAENTSKGPSASAYYLPLGNDEQIILDFALRIERIFSFIKKSNTLLKKERPIEVKMTFLPSVFESVETS